MKFEPFQFFDWRYAASQSSFDNLPAEHQEPINLELTVGGPVSIPVTTYINHAFRSKNNTTRSVYIDMHSDLIRVLCYDHEHNEPVTVVIDTDKIHVLAPGNPDRYYTAFNKTNHTSPLKPRPWDFNPTIHKT